MTMLQGKAPLAFNFEDIYSAREIVGRKFSHKEAQDLSVDDLLELAMLIKAEAELGEKQ